MAWQPKSAIQYDDFSPQASPTPTSSWQPKSAIDMSPSVDATSSAQAPYTSTLAGSQPNTPQAQPQQPKSMTQQGSDFLRMFGLGFLPNLAANVQDTVGTLQSGKPADYGGKYDNLFRTQDEFNQAVNGNPLKEGAMDTAGMASWMMPELGAFKGSQIATNALRGGLGSASQSLDPANIALGATGAGLIGPVLHPLQSFYKGVPEMLSNSPALVDMNSLIDRYEKDVLPGQILEHGQPAQDVFSNLDTDMVNRASAARAQVNPLTTAGTQNINLDSVPVKYANDIKQGLQGWVRKNGGYKATADSSPRLDAMSAFATLLKNEIAKQEPQIAMPNALYHAGEQVPGYLNALTGIFGHGVQDFTNKWGGAPLRGLQKAIPQDGGKVARGLPFLLSLLMGNQQNSSNQ